jgi:hypothetical protein
MKDLPASSNKRTLCYLKLEGHKIIQVSYIAHHFFLDFFTDLVRTFGRLTHGRFRNLLRQFVGFLWTSDRPVQRPLPIQDNATQKDTKIHALSGIRTHDLSVQAIKAFASDHAANRTGKLNS